jgi:hypothetical protein
MREMNSGMKALVTKAFIPLSISLITCLMRGPMIQTKSCPQAKLGADGFRRKTRVIGPIHFGTKYEVGRPEVAQKLL